MKNNMRKIVSAVLALTLALALVPQLLSAAQAPLPPYGDLNEDGHVHADDARIALQAAARIIETTDTLLYYGDIDGNGTISSGDARRILRAAAKLEALPARDADAEPTTDGPTTAAPTTDGPTTAGATVPAPTAADLNAAYDRFSADLLKTLYQDGKNILISPLSVMTALSMAENGAKNETLRQMETMFGMDVATMRELLCAYLKALPQSEKSKLVAANSLWIKEDGFAELSEDFVELIRRRYDAEVREEPFDEKTVADVNGWCREHTDGMIEKIVDELPANAVMLLIDALTFDAEWKRIYTTDDVRKHDFTDADGTKKEVEMMFSEEADLIETDTVTGFVKPYAGEQYSFVALLPKEGTTVAELIASLDGEAVAALLNGAQKAPVAAGIPKFQCEYAASLVDTLKEMGMTDAFHDDRADFTGIGVGRGGNLYLSDVVHKTFISVDERGTRAGAVTLVVVAEKAIMQMRRVILDRPFVYMIVENATGLPAFIGAVNHI